MKDADWQANTLKSIIVGYGHAGNNLHRRCIGKASACGPVSGEIGIVEPRPLESTAGLPLFRSMGEVKDFGPGATVVHICTPPADHACTVHEAAELGFRMFIAEKPLATTRAEADWLMKAAGARGLKIVPNLPWADTPLTARLLAIVGSGSHGDLVRFEMVQHKSRPPRQREILGRDSAFDVEMPHQISLALQVAGRDATVVDASAKAYLAETGPVPFLGGASMTLRHGKTVSVLQSDLDSPVKERRVDLYFEDGLHARGWYPVDGTDGSQRLCLFDEKGALRAVEKFWSDPMTDLFAQAYRYFLGAGPAPLATLPTAARVYLACYAKVACGIEPKPADIQEEAAA